ncbi:3-hydroxyacyl-CoA dehydrogenase family protein [Polynucleobacter necessarius]|uniref:3-hydroxyacyl-CoA dehydrogenase family protein n=1 Tax=Polynucleobacter necessarius TaxID=576610 RepID=UPI0018D4F124|nr:3-hydroxyacyl-CoA dehydrogenase NAD-binding domain-containing protein [Polynucleobacter necessarius]
MMNNEDHPLLKHGQIMSKVVVIGSGTMGIGIAAGFLACGANTVLLGCDSAKVMATLSDIESCADSIDADWRNRGGRLQGANIKEWDDWADTDFVIETVSERIELKKEIFADLDQRVPPHIPIASNSSGFPISDIAGSLPTANRMFNVHYFMPAHIVPLVEIVLGQYSSPEMANQLCAFFRAHGKKPVLVKKIFPGF